ncbi:L-lactate permease [Mycobacterium terramassiliense]|uniref:L-lactate permease n=1 Tax=Mycobacterium terramassiliense TaxID=1841859 RepID=A0A2U3NA73_9MYCO|nr:L-lactate permease [Mycobacterium terramassiliense]SPM28431.1 L-lactate permease [Mycobacterium terramassiliense]
MFQPDYTPVAHSLGWSAAVAALPLVIMFVLLGGLRVRAPIAAAVGVGTAALIAWGAYHMPVAQVADSAVLGFAYGMFPIMWLVLNAIWIYNLTVQTGHRDVLCRSMASISPDQRIQAVIVAFCFGALIEGLAGFGTPVAITSLMLVALRFSPLKAAAVALVANTAPVAFASLGIPIVALSGVTGLPLDTLGAMVGRQTPILACIVPFILIFMVDGRAGLKHAWPAAAMGGGVYAIVQFLCSNFFSVELTDIAGSIISAGSIVLLLRVWRPKAPLVGATEKVALTHENQSATAPVGRPDGAVLTAHPASGVRDEVADSRRDVLLAYAPYVMVTAIFSVSMWKPFTALLKHGGTSFAWPGLHVANAAHKASPLTVYKLDFLSAAGTLLLASGLLTMLVLRTSVGQALRAYAQAAIQLRSAALTVGLVLALAYLLNLSGETTTLGLWIAGAGGLLGIVAPIIGWLGVTVTGSDTSSNSLFGVLQVSAAHSAGLSPTLLAAANSSGGVIGKMLSPQSLVIATAAVQMKGREGDLFRVVLKWSLLLLALMCLLVYLQTTSWLGWMVA